MCRLDKCVLIAGSRELLWTAQCLLASGPTSAVSPACPQQTSLHASLCAVLPLKAGQLPGIILF